MRSSCHWHFEFYTWKMYRLSIGAKQDTPQNSGLQQAIISSPPAAVSRGVSRDSCEGWVSLSAVFHPMLL